MTYPEPIASCCGSLTETASVVVEDLTVDDPGCAVPRRCVEDGPQVEEEDRGNTARGQRGGGVGVDTSVENVTTDDPHANRATDGTDHQELSASEVIDEDQNPDDGEDGLDHTEDTGGQVDGILGLNAHRPEHIGAVIVDSVNSGEVLQDEQRMAKEESPSGLRVLESLLDRLEEAPREIVDLLLHHGNFFDNVCIVDVQVSDPAKVRDRFVDPAFCEEPTWCLLQEQTPDQQDSSRDELDGERGQPLLSARRKGFDHSVVDPETDHSTDLPA